MVDGKFTSHVRGSGTVIGLLFRIIFYIAVINPHHVRLGGSKRLARQGDSVVGVQGCESQMGVHL